MSPDEIRELDRLDPLAAKRDLFALPEGVVYLDGNSLGALPLSVRQRAAQIVDQQWGRDLVTSWNTHAWIDLPVTVGEKIAPLLGAAAGQVICCDSISVNLFKLLAAALQMRRDRHVVVSQDDNFPADLYIAEGLGGLDTNRSLELRLVADAGIENALDDSVAVLMLTHVNYRSGKIHDMQRLTRLAHDKGIMVIWDLAHSAGAVPLALDDCGVDFAVGCGYKYLNGGPGAPAFIYAAQRHQHRIKQPLSGWMGHAAPFEFGRQYRAAPGVRQFLCGTPPILSMGALDAALDVFAGVDMQELRDKSRKLGDLFLELAGASGCLAGFELVSPADSALRGSQLALAHPRAFAICQAMIDKGVIADFRAPDVLRLGFAPLYLRYIDVARSVEVLADVMVNKSYTQERYSTQQKVT